MMNELSKLSLLEKRSLRLKKFRPLLGFFVLLFFFAFACRYTEAIAPPGSLPEPTQTIQTVLQIPYDVYLPGMPVQVAYQAPASISVNAWVGLIPSGVPHGDESENRSNVLDYRLLNQQTNGVLTFVAPQEPGSYDLRMNDLADKGEELASVTFVVSADAADIHTEPSLKLERNAFHPGEEIQLFFTAPSEVAEIGWVAILQNHVHHGDVNLNKSKALALQYMDGRISGILIFNAPAIMGSYEFRMNTDSTEGEYYILPFQVFDD